MYARVRDSARFSRTLGKLYYFVSDWLIIKFKNIAYTWVPVSIRRRFQKE